LAAEAALNAAACSLAQNLENYGLCHGELGIAESLLVASFVLPGRHEWRKLAYDRASAIVEDMSANGWLSVPPQHAENPGLMTGTAGVGFELLRFIAPSIVPSVLLLESPLKETSKIFPGLAFA
jgi:lantibiotic modifying enzyme